MNANKARDLSFAALVQTDLAKKIIAVIESNFCHQVYWKKCEIML